MIENPSPEDETLVEKALEDAVHLAEDVKHELSDMMNSSFNSTITPLMKSIENGVQKQIEEANTHMNTINGKLEEVNDKVNAAGSRITESVQNAEKSLGSSVEEVKSVNNRLLESSNTLTNVVNDLIEKTRMIESQSNRIREQSESIGKIVLCTNDHVTGTKKLLETLQAESIPSLTAATQELLRRLQENEELLAEMKDRTAYIDVLHTKIKASMLSTYILGGSCIVLLIWILINTY